MGGVGLTQMLSWFYGVKLPSIFTGTNGVPYMSPSTPFITGSVWRADGPSYFQGPAIKNLAQDSLGEDWSVAVATKSTVLGHDREQRLDPLRCGHGANVGGRARRLCDVLAHVRGDRPGRTSRRSQAGHGARAGRPTISAARPPMSARRRRWGTRSITRARASRSMPDRASTMTSSNLRAASTGPTASRAHPSLGFTGGRRIALALGGPHLWRPDFGARTLPRPRSTA